MGSKSEAQLDAVTDTSKSKNKSKSKVKSKHKKDSQLVLRLDKEERDAFVDLCKELDTSAAREIRGFIRKFMKKNKR